jgi:hypothetical protein
MLARYAHIRVQARRDAIAALEKNRVEGFPSADERGWAQNWAQSAVGRQEASRHCDAKPLKSKDLSLVGVAGFEPATTRTPSVNAGFSPVILLTTQYAPSSSLSVGICSFNPDISAYWRTRNSSESPHKSPHSLRRANDNPGTRFLSPLVSRSSRRLPLAENPDQRPNPLSGF